MDLSPRHHQGKTTGGKKAGAATQAVANSTAASTNCARDLEGRHHQGKKASSSTAAACNAAARSVELYEREDEPLEAREPEEDDAELVARHHQGKQATGSTASTNAANSAACQQAKAAAAKVARELSEESDLVARHHQGVTTGANTNAGQNAASANAAVTAACGGAA